MKQHHAQREHRQRSVVQQFAPAHRLRVTGLRLDITVEPVRSIEVNRNSRNREGGNPASNAKIGAKKNAGRCE